MAEPTVLFGIGATKAGTSWLYRMLHDHPDCALPGLKEAHYWDTFDPAESARQISVLQRNIDRLDIERQAARAASMMPKAANKQRQIDEGRALIAVLSGDRSNDRAYAEWLTARPGNPRLVADVTPAYGLLPVPMLQRMAACWPVTRFVYLLRDPLARLWSHVRMAAQRHLRPGEDFAVKANGIMARLLHDGRGGQDEAILVRGDYAAAVGRMTEALAPQQQRLAFCEELYTEDGQRAMAEFLQIGYHPAQSGLKIHEGWKASLNADLAVRAVRFLSDQYDWAARTLGTLPQAWLTSRALAE